MKGSKSRAGRDFERFWIFFQRGIPARARKFHALWFGASAIALALHAQTPQFQITLLGHLPKPESFSIISAMPLGNTLFSVSDEGFLLAHDISQPANPMALGRAEIGGRPNRIYVSGNRAIVASDNRGLQIVDISDPAMPKLLSETLDAGSSVADVVVKGDIAFASVTYGGIVIIDISNPKIPTQIGAMEFNHVGMIALEGSTLVVSALEYSYETTIYDVTNPRAPVFRSTVPTMFQGQFALAGNRLCVVDILSVPLYDITDRAAPRLLGYLSPQSVPQRFVALGDYAYSFGHDNMEALDLRNPNGGSTMIRFVEPYYRETRVFGGRIFAVGSGSGVEIFDMTDPLVPARTGHLDLRATAHDLKIAGTTAYLSNGGAGLQILDVSNPVNTHLIGTARANGTVFASEIHNTLAYVAAGFDGLQIFDIANPASPVLKGHLTTTAKAMDVAVKDTTVYLATGRNGLSVIDASDPTNPHLLTELRFLSDNWAVTRVGNILFAGDNDLAFVLDLTDATNPRLADAVFAFNQVRWISANETRAAIGAFGIVQLADVSDPNNTVLLGTDPLSAADGALQNDYLYLTTYTGVEIQDAWHARRFPGRGSIATERSATTIAVVGEKVYVGLDDGSFSIFQATAPPRVRVKPPANDARHHVRDSVRIEWTTELITNPTWSLELQGKTLTTTPIADSANTWHANVTIPANATNSLTSAITVRDLNTRAEGYYETFVVEQDAQLEFLRSTNQVQLKWNSFFTNYSLFRGTNIALPANWTKITNGITTVTNRFSFTEKTTNGAAAFFQLRRNAP